MIPWTNKAGKAIVMKPKYCMLTVSRRRININVDGVAQRCLALPWMGIVAPEAAVDPLPWRDYKKDKVSARWLLAQDRQTKTLHPESLACQSVHLRRRLIISHAFNRFPPSRTLYQICNFKKIHRSPSQHLHEYLLLPSS